MLRHVFVNSRSPLIKRHSFEKRALASGALLYRLAFLFSTETCTLENFFIIFILTRDSLPLINFSLFT